MTETHPGFARGWFVVALSTELGPEAVRPLRYFGRDLVAYRGADGQVRVLDAHCPHLGAHLGIGGRVVGDQIECPFHAWRFDGTGQCAAIPYAQKIPPKARVGTWPVLERNGIVFVFHARGGGPPEYEIPVLAEYGDPAWLPWSTKCLTVRTQPREIVENVADKAHFPPVHRTEVEVFENSFDEIRAVQHTIGVAHPVGGGEDRFDLTATYYGPAYQITVMDGVLSSRLLLAHTPIDAESLHLRFGVMLRHVGGNPARTEKFAAGYISNLQRGFEEDIALWENKKWRDRPVLCDGDGPIGKLRRWYRTFYENAAEEQT